MKLSLDNPPQVGDWFLVGGKKAVFTREGSPNLHPQVSWADGGLLGKFLEKEWLDMEVTRPPKNVTGEIYGTFMFHCESPRPYQYKGQQMTEEQFINAISDLPSGVEISLVILEDN